MNKKEKQPKKEKVEKPIEKKELVPRKIHKLLVK